MNKLYFIFPLVGVIAFTTYWYSFKTGYDQKKADAKVAAQAAVEAKAESDRVNRLKAIADAVASTERRKAEKAAKLAKEAKEKTEREAAIERRNKEKQEMYKLADQERRLTKEAAELKTEIAKVKEQVADQQRERDHLKKLVAEMQVNGKEMTAVATKVEKADDQIRRMAKDLAGYKKKYE